MSLAPAEIVAGLTALLGPDAVISDVAQMAAYWSKDTIPKPDGLGMRLIGEHYRSTLKQRPTLFGVSSSRALVHLVCF